MNSFLYRVTQPVYIKRSCGHDEVHSILSSRTLLFYFFRDILKIDENTAHNDSCLMEHLLSGETREQFFNFMKSVSTKPEKLKLKTKLDLKDYKCHEEFIHAQVGDRYLDS